MLVSLTCSCGGAEQLARKTLNKANVPYWLDVPIYQGKTPCLNWVKQHSDLDGAEILEHFLNTNSTFVLIVGYTDNALMFANVKNGTVKEQLEAEVIAEKFA